MNDENSQQTRDKGKFPQFDKEYLPDFPGGTVIIHLPIQGKWL